MKELTIEQEQAIDEYGHLVTNTGGNDIKELLKRDDFNVQTNLPLTVLQISVNSQISLIINLKRKGLLK